MPTIELDDYEIFKTHKNTLKELSKDSDNDEYMTDSTIIAVDFDNVKSIYETTIGLPFSSDGYASSVDALVNINDIVTFIEFKNGDMSNEKTKVKIKIRDSLLIFGAITNKNISFTNQNAEFILVYNLDKNPLPAQITNKEKHLYQDKSRIEISKLILKKANQEFVLFGMETFKKLYFKDVHTFSKEEFENYLQNNN